MHTRELNLDGLVGPTHNYAGLSPGNVASVGSAGSASNPRAAALEGIAKMEALHALGLWQGVIPPHHRPAGDVLARLGFDGPHALDRAPLDVLARVFSASAMWTANAATVAPAADTADGRLHLVPANLVDKFHRSIEHPQTTRTLRALFADSAQFCVHEALPAHPDYADEGAANHTRLCSTHDAQGLHVFVWGRSVHHGTAARPQRFAARQTLEASEAVARRLGLVDQSAVFVQQNPAAIDAGVFHNDVIAVGNEHLLLVHEQAFVDQPAVLDELRRRVPGLVVVEVSAQAVPLAEVVSSYLFNSQLVTLPDGTMTLVAPSECAENPRVADAIAGIVDDPTNPVTAARYFDLRQSMRNGGGPACLRLRVVLTASQRDAVAQGVVAGGGLDLRGLRAWVNRHYRDRLQPGDLRDPALAVEVEHALDELTQLLGLGPIYPFQT